MTVSDKRVWTETLISWRTDYCDLCIQTLLHTTGRHRRLKLGSQLLAVLEAHAKASGMNSIVLSTAAVPAMSFYERNGYLVTHETHMGKRLVKSYQKSLV